MKRFTKFPAAALILIGIGAAFCSPSFCHAVEPLPKHFSCAGDACSISAPTGWTSREEKGGSELALVGGDETYTTVWAEPKEDFIKMDLETLAKKRVEEMKAKLLQPTVSSPTAMTVGKLKGLQFQITGGIDNLNISYLYTILEGEKNYFRVLQWTLKSKYSAKLPLYQQVMRTIEER